MPGTQQVSPLRLISVAQQEPHVLTLSQHPIKYPMRQSYVSYPYHFVVQKLSWKYVLHIACGKWSLTFCKLKKTQKARISFFCKLKKPQNTWISFFCKLKKPHKTWISFFCKLKKPQKTRISFFASLKKLKKQSWIEIFTSLKQAQKTFI